MWSHSLPPLLCKVYNARDTIFSHTMFINHSPILLKELLKMKHAKHAYKRGKNKDAKAMKAKKLSVVSQINSTRQQP